MAATEPMPRLSSSRPRMASSTASRPLANGTRGAQPAMPKPATQNESRVASRVAGRSAEGIDKTPGKTRDHGRDGALQHQPAASAGVPDALPARMRLVAFDLGKSESRTQENRSSLTFEKSHPLIPQKQEAGPGRGLPECDRVGFRLARSKPIAT